MPIKFFQKLPETVHRAAAWHGIPWVLALIALTDFFVMFIPSDLFLVAAILGYQRRMPLFAASMVMGRLVGAVGLHYMLQTVPLETLHELAMNWGAGGAWERGQYFFEKFGPLSIGITALTPFPMLVPTAMSSVSGAPLWQIIFFTLLGGGVRYALVCAGIVAGKELYMEHFPVFKKSTESQKISKPPADS